MAPSDPRLFRPRSRLVSEALMRRASAIATPPSAPMLSHTNERLVNEAVLTRVCACSDLEIEALFAAHGLPDGRLALAAEIVVDEVELCKQQARAHRRSRARGAPRHAPSLGRPVLTKSEHFSVHEHVHAHVHAQVQMYMDMCMHSTWTCTCACTCTWTCACTLYCCGCRAVQTATHVQRHAKGGGIKRYAPHSARRLDTSRLSRG